jgi:hypothetical protein
MTRLPMIVVFLLLLLNGHAAAQDLPPRDSLPPGAWHQLSPGGETTCGHGAPYSFYYREGPGQDLLLNFQGGGMCWNAQTCNVSTTTFDDWINPGDPSDNPALSGVGIYDFGNGDNPFVNYDIVHVNYCTGDMHMGNNVVGFDFEGTWYETRFKGQINVSAVLNWVYNNIPDPDSVFVTGCSAGSVGAAYWADDIMEHYRGERVALLGDSGGGWKGGVNRHFALWNAPATSIEGLYADTARRFPQNRVAMYNTAADETQMFFNFVGFSSAPYDVALSQNLGYLANRARSFRFYTEGGSLHCILPRAEFYTYATTGVRLRDWVANIAAGVPVNSVECIDCDSPSYVGGW